MWTYFQTIFSCSFGLGIGESIASFCPQVRQLAGQLTHVNEDPTVCKGILLCTVKLEEGQFSFYICSHIPYRIII